MRKNIPRLLLMGALLSPSAPFALGLGDIRLNSALNQPFDAEIDLLSATTEELASLQVGLANNETFSRYGLDRPGFLSNFTFRVTRAADGRTVLRVTSAPSVTEPFVTLLVEASWSRGRLLREYTVLLDPPVFTPGPAAAAPAPVAAPRAGAPSEGVIERPQAPAAPAAPTPPAAAAPAPGAAVGDSYRVQRNDTLWNIASRIRPGSIRVVNQTMIALYRANPEAFDGNINQLRAGTLLRVPAAGEIESIAQSDAASEVAQQYRNWRGATAAATEEGGRLRLVTPAETSSAPAVGPATPPPANNGLQQQVTTLEGQLAEAQRLLAVRNAELAEMQRRLGTGAAPAPAPEAPVAPAPAETPPAATAEPPTAVEPVAEAPVVEPPATAPAAPAPAVVEPPAEPSLLDRLGEYWWALAGLGLALLIGVAVWFRNRRMVDIDDVVETMTPSDFGSRGRATGPQSARSRTKEESFLVEEGDDADDTAEIQSVKKPVAPVVTRVDAAPKKTADDTLSSETAVHFDQQDALAEADFHMAYGLYDQAADLVKIAIEREPSRRELRLKLLEIYFVWGNKDLFLDSARQLYQTRDEAAAGEWDKILIMGRQISPEDPMFQGEAGVSRSTDVVDLNLEGGENRVDVDLFGPDGGEEGKLDFEFGADGKPEKSTSDSGIDFLLDEPRRGADEEPTREIEPGARTQETPTIESPYLGDRASETIREQIDTQAITKLAPGVDQTAELSLDDLGLDVSSFEETGSPLDTDAEATGERTGTGFDLDDASDDDATRLADHSFLGSYDRTVESPRPENYEGTGTVVISESDGDTVERPRTDSSATARMKAVDFDLDSLSDDLGAPEGDTVKREGRTAPFVDDLAEDIFAADRTAQVPSLDLDVGNVSDDLDDEPTKTEAVTSMMDMPELEPVTMSEVGTKLDLARAYMDMGDPDGARSILEEVMQEGSTSQKQEAERLLDSIR